jgi:hypothetical protein
MADQFVKEQFDCHGGYLTYQGRFVARCKYRPTDASSVRTFLIKNFTITEYFDRLAAGESPLPILESKGYLLPHIKKWLKEGGYPVNREGYKMLLAKQAAEIHKRLEAKNGW